MALFIFLFLLLFPTQLHAQSIQPAVVEDFGLLDEEGQFHQFSYYSDKKAIVLFVVANGCPIVRQSLPVLEELRLDFESEGVKFLLFNPQDDRESVNKEAREFAVSFPILGDEKGIIAQSLDMKRTAEALVIEPKTGRIIYRGAIDDRLNYEGKRLKADRHYLRDALSAFLNGKEVLVSRTDVKGCLLHFPKSVKLSYAKDIAPILTQKCVVCHTVGGAAPWSMDSYEKVKRWGPMIREVVRTGRMPPWDADPHFGEFKKDIALTPDETRRIIHWVEQGMERGKGKDPLLTMPSLPSGWILGAPDLVFSLKEKQVIPATGTDVFTVVEADQAVDRDLWIRAIQIKPGNARVVHHCNIAIHKTSGDRTFMDEQFPEANNMEKGDLIAGYSPGIQTVELPEDTGIFVPKGSRISFRLHYVTTGKVEEDLTQVALYLYPRKPGNDLGVASIVNRDLAIPPGEQHYAVTGSYTFPTPALLTGLQPHMHYRGKFMRFTAFYPDGTSEILLSVPRYRFSWQRIYDLKQPKLLPAGTRVVLDGIYDNSQQNPYNPDSTQTVLYGPQSGAEMFTGVMFYIKKDSGSR